MYKKDFLKNNSQMLIMMAAMLLIGVTLLYRALHGLELTDEAYYLATAKRFYDGDMLFRDDWNRGQIFGLLMEPFYRMYVFFSGSNEGIILCSRILFIMLEVYVSLFVYQMLLYYMKNSFAPLMSALCIFVYARGNIITVSYYNLGFLTFILTILWWAKAEDSKNKKLYCILSGINFSVSVLCMPYMIILFSLFMALGLYWKIKRYMDKSNQILWFLAGIIISMSAFFICFWKMIPWEELFEYIPVVFSDPGLEQEGILYQFYTLIEYFMVVFLKYMWPLYGLTFIFAILAGSGWIKNPIFRKKFSWILIVEFFVQSAYVRTYFEGGIVVTFFLLVLQMQIVYPEVRLKQFERIFIIPGVLFGCIWVLGSNVDERVINMSFLFMDLWAIPFLWKLWQEHKKNVRMIMYSPVFLMFFVLYIIRCFDIYRDGSIEQLVYPVSKGSMKGIYTEESRGKIYEDMVDLLREETDSENTIVVLGCNPWVYLDASASCGAYTTWEIRGNESGMRQYYKKLPEKIPDVILCVPEELGRYVSWRYSSHGSGQHINEQVTLEGILSEIVTDNEYECLKKNGCIIFKQRF